MVKKLKRIHVEEHLKSLGLKVCTPLEFRDIFGVSQGTASVFISHNLAQGGIFVKLRNGIYMLKDSQVSQFFLANRIYEPSYISLNSALSQYGIIPEVVYATTSITSKTSREFETPKGNFIYQHIKQSVFTGYSLHIINKERVLIATPEKALADHLYFVDLNHISLNDRLELRHINKKRLMHEIELFDRASMYTLVKHIYARYHKSPTIY